MKPIFFYCFIASLMLAQPSFAQKKAKKDKQATTTTATTSTKGIKKDGTPDMRYKKNREAVQKETPPPAMNTPMTTATTSVPKKTKTTQRSTTVPMNNTRVTSSVPMQGQNRSARVVGTDAKGRTIYEGPKGGRYYINGNGNKEYEKH